jgi:hypothetical protein
MTTKKIIKDEDATLNFRIPKVLKATIISKAQQENMTSSKYLRNLLEAVHNGSYCHQDKLKSERVDFLFSKEFLQLIVWIYRKQVNNRREVEKSFLERYIKTLKRTENCLPKSIIFEFDKVLKSLLIVRDSGGYDGNVFDFPSSYSSDKKFNYEKVEKFLLEENVFEVFIDEGENTMPDILL